MSTVAVLNTDAQVNGKTLLLAENAQTVTGLQTFDRDPNAPFAVAPGSAVVANLDADKVDGLDAVDWTSYTPVCSGDMALGNGTVTGRYMRFGDLVFYKIVVTVGSTTTFAGLAQASITLPTLPSGQGSQTIILTDNGGQAFVGQGIVESPGINIYQIDTDGNQAQYTFITQTTPFAWSSGDTIHVSGWYEAA